MIYYSTLTIWGYQILKDKHFFPKKLGGSGDLQESYRGYPYQDFEGRDQVTNFILVQLGYHPAEITRLLFFSTKRGDIVEMMTHEVLTIWLYGCCYLINIHEIGAVISWLHDASDILVFVSKILAETRYKKSTVVAFFTMCFLWLYTRMLVFPGCAYVVASQDIDYGAGTWIICPFFGYCLYCLVFMHYYWFCLFLQIIHGFATKGKVEDGVAKEIKEDKPKVQ